MTASGYWAGDVEGERGDRACDLWGAGCGATMTRFSPASTPVLNGSGPPGTFAAAAARAARSFLFDRADRLVSVQADLPPRWRHGFDAPGPPASRGWAWPQIRTWVARGASWVARLSSAGAKGVARGPRAVLGV